MVIKKSEEVKPQKWIDKASSLRSNLRNRTNQRRSRIKAKVEDSQEVIINLDILENQEDETEDSSIAKINLDF